MAYGIAPGDITAASYASLLGGLLGALWLILGTLGTPFLMQALICSGAPMTSGGTSGLQQLYAVQQIAWMIKSIKTAGIAALPAVLSRARTGTKGSGGRNPPPPPPPINLPVNSPGDRRPGGGGNCLPNPQTTI